MQVCVTLPDTGAFGFGGDLTLAVLGQDPGEPMEQFSSPVSTQETDTGSDGQAGRQAFSLCLAALPLGLLTDSKCSEPWRGRG